MHRVGAGRLARLDDLVGVEVRLRSGRRAEVNGFIRHQHVGTAGIRVRIDRYGLDAHLPRRADDAARNFATVRDQDLGDCHYLSLPQSYFRPCGPS